MRLLRYGVSGAEKPGLVDKSGRLRDLSGTIADIAGDVLTPDGLAKLAKLKPENLPEVGGKPRLGPPLARIGKIIGVGLNYSDHAKEVGLPLPKEPTLFLKATSSLAGPTDDLRMPRDGVKLDWEVELGVVIGQGGVYISETAAMDHVAGYCLGIDFTEREFQYNRGGQGFKGKSSDTFGPLGPWLVTRDEIADPHELKLHLTVNGVTRQNGNTSNMIYSVGELVSYCSRFMSLQTGDVILTGTPAGVAKREVLGDFLKPGDEVIATIDGLGEQRHRVADSH